MNGMAVLVHFEPSEDGWRSVASVTPKDGEISHVPRYATPDEVEAWSATLAPGTAVVRIFWASGKVNEADILEAPGLDGAMPLQVVRIRP